MKYKAAVGKLEVKSKDDDYVYIEGWANYSAPDNVKERLDAETVDDSRYSINPVLLYNHDKSYPVGKSIVWNKGKDGLFVKCAISKSTHPNVSFVRDLVEEGILKTFSVGFSGGDTENDPENPGSFLTRNWRWHELSIVAIPMQQDSTFTLTKAYGNNLSKCKSYSEAKIMTLTLKGAKVAALISPVFDPMEPGMKQEAVAKICEAAGCQTEELQSVLTGEMQVVPEQTLAAISQVLGINLDELNKANEEDKAPPAQEQSMPEDKPKEEEPKEEKPADPELSKAAKDMSTCISEKIAKLVGEGKPHDQAVAVAVSMCSEEKGCAPSELTDGDWAHFLSMTPETKQKDLVPADLEANLHIQLMQQMVSSLGSLDTKLASIIQLLTAYMAKEVTDEVAEKPEPAQDEMKALLREASEINARLKSYMV